MPAQPEVEALEQYQTIRAAAIALATALQHTRPRDSGLMRQVGDFQVMAGVVGSGNQRTGNYGPATQQALAFFLPSGVAVPPVWPGVGPGTWTPPAWVREARGPTIVTQPTPRSYGWLWGVAAAVAGLGALGFVLVRRGKTTERDLVYASPWLYAHRGRRGTTALTRTEPSERVLRQLAAQRAAMPYARQRRGDASRIPGLPKALFEPGGGKLPAAATAKILGYR